jgi:hypothetical protein
MILRVEQTSVQQVLTAKLQSTADNKPCHSREAKRQSIKVSLTEVERAIE